MNFLVFFVKQSRSLRVRELSSLASYQEKNENSFGPTITKKIILPVGKQFTNVFLKLESKLCCNSFTASGHLWRFLSAKMYNKIAFLQALSSLRMRGF
jgi:hypothetical protein